MVFRHEDRVPGASGVGELGPLLGIELIEGQEIDEVVVLLDVAPSIPMVGEDLDASRLFEAAMRVARRRVVVKRPRRGELLGPNPDHQHEGKSTRFDIYLTAGRERSQDSGQAVD